MDWRQALLEYAKIKPAVNQIEVHPYMRNDYNIKYCASQVRQRCRQLLSTSLLWLSAVTCSGSPGRASLFPCKAYRCSQSAPRRL